MYYTDMDSKFYYIQEADFCQSERSETRPCEIGATSGKFCASKMKRVQTIELQTIKESKELYYLLTGMSYTKIGIKFYGRNTNKFIYKIRKLMKIFNLANRRQLAYFAVKNHLVTLEKIEDFN